MSTARLTTQLPVKQWIARAWVALGVLCGAYLAYAWFDGLADNMAQDAAAPGASLAGAPRANTAEDVRRMYEGGGSAEAVGADFALTFP